MAVNLSRLVQAVVSRARERGGYVTKTKLAKYLYLLDIAHYRRTGTILTGFPWRFHLYGPWTEDFERLYANLIETGRIEVSASLKPDVEAEFVSSSQRVPLEEAINDPQLQLEFRRIVDTWAGRRLGEMLDYVYFHTEPMEGATRGAALDFGRVDRQPAPRPTQVPPGGAERREIERLRRAVRARLTGQTQPASEVFTPPPYDTDYFEALRVMETDEGY